MENASKALLMAAEVLIGIVILSLMVYMFITFGMSSSEIHKAKEETQLEQFNSQFTKYEGKNDVTIYDVITVANLATESNKYYGFNKRANLGNGNDYYIWVFLSGNGYIEKGTDNDSDINYDSIISDNIKNNMNSDGSLKTYTCKVKISGATGRVYEVRFE